MLQSARYAKAPVEFQKEELEAKINTKQSQYDFLNRLDYFLPAIDSALCSTMYLNQVYENTIYAPKQN